MQVRKLNLNDKELLILHLRNLQGEDRRLRFGATVTDPFIDAYVAQSFVNVRPEKATEKSQWLGVDGPDGQLIAACHVAIHAGEAELGCSVAPEHRGKKLAQAMFDRAVTYLRTKGIREVFMNCLTENQVMKHIAKKNQMTVVSCCGDTDARVSIESPTAVTPLRDAYLDRMAACDMLIKGQFKLMQDWLTH